MSISEDVN